MKLAQAAVALLAFCGAVAQQSRVDPECGEAAAASIRLDAGHPWRPPFRLDRIGRPLEAVVQLSLEERPIRDYILAGYRDGKEIERHMLRMRSRKPPYIGTASFEHYPDELVLLAQCRYAGKPAEIARQKIELPAFEAEAVARAQQPQNPVDLNSIFVPQDWVLVPGGQGAIVEVAAISNDRNREANVKAWFESSPKPAEAKLALERGARSLAKLEVSGPRAGSSRDVLHVTISEPGGRQIWEKRISAMVAEPRTDWPAFGAVETKLRYALPISVRDPATGRFSTLDYEKGWDPRLNDVVIRLPNGSRYVFWRGSSYIPFWAGRHGTGLSYEWAETTPPPDGFVDSVEPLMDKELRYGRVKILESTPSRVHVRWDYQSTDFTYKVWGDAASEDYYFYPDGMGTRVMTLKAKPDADYELSEFIILTPPSAYPLEVVPRNTVDMLYLDGEKKEMLFPAPGASEQPSYLGRKLENPRKLPIVYRIRMHRDDREAAIYFNPNDRGVPMLFNSFFDRGYLVTPAYWGSHWPLARGNTTGSTIDDRITLTPSHNSMMTWGLSNRPAAVSRAEITTLDSLGAARPMVIQRWAWLIGVTDANDAELLDLARSFSAPATLQVSGARLDLQAYVQERRAYRLQAEGRTIEIEIKPSANVVNPVFEIEGAPKQLKSVVLVSSALKSGDYAWDGHTLWIRAKIESPQKLVIQFGA